MSAGGDWLFSLVLKQLREEKGLSQYKLAELLGVAQSTVGMWESGKREPDFAMVKRLADFFSVSTDYLLDRPAKSKGVPIPVLGRVPAGIPIEAVQEILDYEEITPEMASQGEFFALQIRGDSMAPRIREGDVVIVRKQNWVDNGDVAVVLVNGEDATVKRFYQSEQGVKLVSANPAYEPLFYTASEVKSLPVVIIGKVVELRGKL